MPACGDAAARERANAHLRGKKKQLLQLLQLLQQALALELANERTRIV
jgi:hypothetical protein